MTLDAGTRVAQYRLERKLGSGGMGEVYLARDTKLDRLVAIKFLTAPDAAQSRRRLMREARAAAALDHPDICAIYEVGSDPVGGDFIAMQYVEGESLAARLRRGRLRPEESLAIGAHIAEALMAAHRRGIVHRDLKPQNIIITASGAPKLLDFGLATVVAGTRSAADAMTVSQLTGPGAIVGTPGYMAPEQVRGESADFRADVFALGCVLYECLTGKRAFSGATSADVLGAVLHVEPPPPSSVVPEIGTAYDQLCMRLLEKAPADRFQSAEEVLGAIRAQTPSEHFRSGPLPVAPAPRRLLSPRAAALLTASVVVVSTGFYWLWQRSRTPPVPPAEAAQWYDRGAEAMRDGSYANARAQFAEAIRIFPRYAQAHARLAEAHNALDDERSAREELLRVTEILPDPSWLGPDDRLRFEASRAMALREFDKAVAASRALADRAPKDAGRLVDVGRAEEAAGKRKEAREDYAKAVALDGQYAAAHLRVGILQAQAGLTDQGLASLDEAIRLYRTAAKTEGEAQALLAKGIALSSRGKFDDAREYLNRVIQFAAEPPYAAQRVRGQIELARVSYYGGAFAEAEDFARRAIAEATAANLQTLAAAGFLEMGNSLLVSARYDEAEGQYVKALDLAVGREAKRVEMRARLAQASVRSQIKKPEEALALLTAPMKYFADTNDPRLETTAKILASRANEDLERYDEASRLTADVLAFAESSKDDVIRSQALEDLAGQLVKQGRWPEALAYREQLDDMRRQSKDPSSLAIDLTNHARLLILLGRRRDADALIAEIESQVAAGVTAYADRPPRLALLRALEASTEQHFAEVGVAVQAFADAVRARDGSNHKPGDDDLTAKIFAEHALAHLGKSREAPHVIAGWAHDASKPADRRENAYWVARTLLARGEAGLAWSVASEAIAAPAAQANPELGWRLATVAVDAARRIPAAAAEQGASMSARAKADLDRVASTWAAAAAAYFARPDLAAMKKDVH